MRYLVLVPAKTLLGRQVQPDGLVDLTGIAARELVRLEASDIIAKPPRPDLEARIEALERAVKALTEVEDKKAAPARVAPVNGKAAPNDHAARQSAN